MGGWRQVEVDVHCGTKLVWKRARLIAIGQIIVGDGGRFRVNAWEPVMPLSLVGLTLTDLATGEQFGYTARWDDHYAVASDRGGAV
jgi:hypothetical protein